MKRTPAGSAAFLVAGALVLAVVPAAARAGEPAHTARCSAADLLARGGREAGGFHGYAEAGVQFANTSDSACRLSGAPRVTVFKADGTRLPLRFRVSHRATLHSVTLPSGSAWSASTTLSWTNWCGRKPGPLTVKVRLAGGGVVTGSFDGPPGYDFVPGCLDRLRPSRLVLVDAFSKVK